ncbi:RNase adapter RapZ [Streptosporangium sp. NPDC051023]|uniref:RapZ C-terminal domain-containing protein n=1 Tax=Streptosporangium sp. NPDC051023 TaxID=3155410 RepID=UPI00345029B2
MADVVITSFGYGHAPAPEADLTIDARRHLRNPHADPRMRELTGLDAIVRDHVLATPGAQQLIRHAAATAKDLLAVARQHPVTVAVGCVGGRHRSTAIACEISEALRGQGIAVVVEHRDVAKPVIQK